MDQDALTEVLGSSVTHFAAIGADPMQVEYNNLMDVRQNLAGKLQLLQARTSDWIGLHSTSIIQGLQLVKAEPGLRYVADQRGQCSQVDSVVPML